MNEDYRIKLTEFLNPYIEVKQVGIQDGIMTERAIRQGLKLLVKEGLFSSSELRKEILKQYGIIIPELLQEVDNEKRMED
jgi:hypothetical protein